MERENRLSIINTHLDKAIMEADSTTERDWLLECQVLIKKSIWHLKSDKTWKKKKK